MGQFRLTDQAEEDFDGIGAYSQDRWGEDQAVRYLSKLDETFAVLAQTPTLGTDRSDLRTGLISCSCNRHEIFFRRDAKGNVEVLRIPHKRMDFVRHL